MPKLYEILSNKWRKYLQKHFASLITEMSIINLIQIRNFVESMLNNGQQLIFLITKSLELYHNH